MSIRRVVAALALATTLAVAFTPSVAAASPAAADAVAQSDTTTTMVATGEDDAVDNLSTSFEDTGDDVDILSIAALVAGLLGMLMGGAALARTSRKD